MRTVVFFCLLLLSPRVFPQGVKSAVELKLKIISHGTDISSFCYTPDGKYLLVSQSDTSFLIIETRTGEEFWNVRHPEKNKIRCFAPVPPNKVAICFEMKDIVVYNFETGEAEKRFYDDRAQLKYFSNKPMSVACSPDAKYLALCGEFGTIIWDYESGSVVDYDGVNAGQVQVQFTSNSKWILTRSKSRTSSVICVFKSPQLKKIDCKQFDKYTFFGPFITDKDCKKIFTTGDNHPLLLKFSGNKIIHDFPDAKQDVEHIALSPDGKWAVTSHTDGTLNIWDLDTYKVCFSNNYQHLTYIAFSPDSKEISIALTEKQIQK